MDMITETPLFFNSSNTRLFGVIHAPEKEKSKKTGIVLVAPFAEEKLWSLRVFVNMARLLASKGYHVMRFDHSGHGDSEKDHGDISFEDILSDTRRACEVLKEKTGLEKTGFIGLRLGATAAAYAVEDSNSSFIVMWEPVINGSTYLQQCLRSNIASQMMIYRQVLRTREKLMEDVENGMAVNIDGYMVSSILFKGIADMNLSGLENIGNIPILIAGISRTGRENTEYKELYLKYFRKNPHSSFITLKEEPFWAESKTYFQKPSELMDSTINWIDNLGI
jgi:exosortase A-associated hydrolase 2